MLIGLRACLRGSQTFEILTWSSKFWISTKQRKFEVIFFRNSMWVFLDDKMGKHCKNCESCQAQVTRKVKFKCPSRPLLSSLLRPLLTTLTTWPVHKNPFFGNSKNAGQFYVTFWWINKCYITNIAPPGASPKPGKWGVPEKSFQNALQKCLFQVWV